MDELTNQAEKLSVYTPSFKPPHTFAQVAMDLWGAKDEAVGAEPAKDTAEKRPASAEPPVPALPSFEQLWAVTDDRVEWTDALVYNADPEHGIPRQQWEFLHRMADRVLKGDLSSYVEVLQKINPLGDLTPYMERISVMAADAASIQVSFQAKVAYLGDMTASKRYLAGIALRSARDLMAILPVEHVAVSAFQGERVLLSVTYDKSSMNRVAFGFLDPVVFTEAAGGQWAL